MQSKASAVVFVSVMASVIAIGSIQQLLGQVPIHFTGFDKLIHAGAYCLLSFSLFVFFPERKRLWVVLITLGGITMEILQNFSLMGLREFSYGDIAANTVGVSLGFLGLILKGKIS